MPLLKNGHHVVLTDMGHVSDLMHLQPKAFYRLVEGFFERGVVDTSDFRHLPFSFEPKWRLTTIGKAIVGAGAVVLLALALWGIHVLAIS